MTNDLASQYTKILIHGETSAIAEKIGPILESKYYVGYQSSRKPIHNTDYHVVISFAGIIDESVLACFSVVTNKLVEVNCIGAVNLLSTFLPAMQQRKYGRIIFMSSIFSEINVPGYGVYSASKAFIDKLVKIAALENAQYGITVNSIQLGYTGIGMGDHRDKDKAIQKPAMKRFCTMQELANAISFIIETEYYTGQNLKLEGGIK